MGLQQQVSHQRYVAAIVVAMGLLVLMSLGFAGSPCNVPVSSDGVQRATVEVDSEGRELQKGGGHEGELVVYGGHHDGRGRLDLSGHHGGETDPSAGE